MRGRTYPQPCDLCLRIDEPENHKISHTGKSIDCKSMLLIMSHIKNNRMHITHRAYVSLEALAGDQQVRLSHPEDVMYGPGC